LGGKNGPFIPKNTWKIVQKLLDDEAQGAANSPPHPFSLSFIPVSKISIIAGHHYFLFVTWIFFADILDVGNTISGNIQLFILDFNVEKFNIKIPVIKMHV